MGGAFFPRQNWAATAGTNMKLSRVIKEIYNTQDGWLFGIAAVLSESTNRQFLKDAGYDTVEKFTEWVTGSEARCQAAVGGNLNSRDSSFWRGRLRHRHRRIQQQLFQHGRHGAFPVNPD